MRRHLVFLVVFVAAASLFLVGTASACPLCYGGDDPETGRAALWAAGFLASSVYGVLTAGALWAWRRIRSARKAET